MSRPDASTGTVRHVWPDGCVLVSREGGPPLVLSYEENVLTLKVGDRVVVERGSGWVRYQVNDKRHADLLLASLNGKGQG